MDARSLNELLDQPCQLQPLLDRARQLTAIQREIRKYLSAPWADALRVANVRGPVLAVHADHAAAATALRHQHDGLIAALNQRLGLQLERLDLKVRPAPTLGAI